MKTNEFMYFKNYCGDKTFIIWFVHGESKEFLLVKDSL